MMIKYVCKFCGQELGEFDESQVNQSQLGFQSLTPLEQQSIINYMSNGDIVANIICDYCEEALEKNPELILIPNPLQ